MESIAWSLLGFFILFYLFTAADLRRDEFVICFLQRRFADAGI
jgi:hypothetical protein